MKNTIKACLLIGICMLTISVSAQTNSKLGHLDFAKLYSLIPGQDSIQKIYSDYQKTIKDQFDAMQAELESKYNDYQANNATWSAIIKQNKEKEIADLQDRMQAFQQNAQQDLQNKESELTAPLIEKAKKAVRDVAKENGFTYVFNSGDNGVTILYTSDNSEDLMPLVKKKLGIKEEKKEVKK
ncbi:MAG: OmpH family outer membrane protein [Lentimicrobiaceae bacterium]|jgi:outer membrane protein|nr:OmpH family outer membrane protein [Lentimicrobiaceae bacterium]